MAAATPSTAARLKTDFTTLEKQLLFGAGKSVQLNLQLGGDLRAKVEQVLIGVLAEREVRIDPAAPFQLVVCARSDTSGGPIEVTERHRRGAPAAVFASEELLCTVSLKTASGQELWSHQQRFSMPRSGTTELEANQVQGALQRQLRESMETSLTSESFFRGVLPRNIFGPLNAILAGASTLTFRDEVPAPAPLRAASAAAY